MKKRWSTWLAVGAAIVLCSAACSSSGGEDGTTDAAADGAETSVDVASDATETVDAGATEEVSEITPDSAIDDTTEADGTAPGTDVIADTDVAKDSDVSPDTDTTNPDDFAELLVKILGPGGRESLQSEGQAMQLAGVVYGGPDSMTWSNSNGQTGSITPSAYWQSPIILLEPGDNILTVTATKGTAIVTDSVRVTYNPYFSFEGPPEVAPDLLFVNEPAKLVVRMRLTAASPGPDGSSVVNPATIQLIEVDAAGKLVQEHTKLVDSGSSTNCDDVQKDSVFSNCLNVSPSAPKTMYFRVRATVTLPGKTFEALSPGRTGRRRPAVRPDRVHPDRVAAEAGEGGLSCGVAGRRPRPGASTGDCLAQGQLHRRGSRSCQRWRLRRVGALSQRSRRRSESGTGRHPRWSRRAWSAQRSTADLQRRHPPSPDAGALCPRIQGCGRGRRG